MQDGQRLGHAANLDVLCDLVEAEPRLQENGPILVRAGIEPALSHEQGHVELPRCLAEMRVLFGCAAVPGME